MALVLSRKIEETLVISGPCTIKVFAINGNRVTIGITADKEVKILRGELQEEEEKAA
jgi:carbon storage regulator CsrA